jgi:prepilin-type N-terminal cleavage/methylation domain-containing protein
MQKLFMKKEDGFTLIEIMVSISIFTILMVMGIAALLSANTAHRRAEGLRSAVDNLNFIMDDMTRTIRTGSAYHCQAFSGPSIAAPLDCPPSSVQFLSLAVEGQEGSSTDPLDQIVYRIVQIPGSLTDAYIDKSISSGTNPKILSTPEVVVDASKSGFVVMHSGTSTDRPYVVIHLVGSVQYKGTTMPFAMQTTVSQRVNNQ